MCQLQLTLLQQREGASSDLAQRQSDVGELINKAQAKMKEATWQINLKDPCIYIVCTRAFKGFLYGTFRAQSIDYLGTRILKVIPSPYIQGLPPEAPKVFSIRREAWQLTEGPEDWFEHMAPTLHTSLPWL